MKPRKRRWRQFGLGSLLILIAVVSVYLAFVGRQMAKERSVRATLNGRWRCEDFIMTLDTKNDTIAIS